MHGRTLPIVLFLFLSLPCLFGCASTAPLPPKAAELNQLGIEAMRTGDLEMASARFSLALEYHPKFVDALVNLGLVDMQRGSFKQARKHLEKAVSINRHVAQPHHGLGVLSEREGKPEKAVNHYRAALEVDPGFAPARANLARLYFVAGRLDYAREQFLRLTEVAPEVGAGWAGLIESLQRLGRQEEADQALERAMQAAPEEPEVMLHAARWLLRSDKADDSEVLLRKLTEVGGPVARSAWGWLAVAKLMRGDRDEAIGAAERALAIDRDDALATYVLSMALSQRGDRDAAAWLERASKLAPGDSVITWEMQQGRAPGRQGGK